MIVWRFEPPGPIGQPVPRVVADLLIPAGTRGAAAIMPGMSACGGAAAPAVPMCAGEADWAPGRYVLEIERAVTFGSDGWVALDLRDAAP